MFRKITNRLNSIEYLNHKIVFLIDLIMLMSATVLSCTLTGALITPNLAIGDIIVIITLAFLLSIFLLMVFNTHRDIIRYSYLKDSWLFMALATTKGGFMSICLILMPRIDSGSGLFYSLILFDTILSFTFLIIIRTAMVSAFEILNNSESSKKSNAVIYGIDNDSFSLMAKINYKSNYRICGFCVFGNQYRKYRIARNQIFSFKDESDFLLLAQRHRIEAVIFPNQTTAITEKNRLIDYCLKHDVKVLITPQVDEIVNSNLEKLNRVVRDVKIEDLLMRDEIQIDMELIKTHFHGKTILITGAAGSIGSELCNQLAMIDVKKMILLDMAETPIHDIRLKLRAQYPELDFVAIVGDVRLKRCVERTISTYKPDIIFHAAAYKHVPLMEENPCDAILTNTYGTKLVADIAVKHGVEKVILVSTDKAVNPTNVMGASKRLAEIYVQSLGHAIQDGKIEGRTCFITTRFGNVLGSQGSVIPLFRRQIENGGPVTVTHPEITRFFMTIPEACKLVVEAAIIGHNNEIVVFDMGKSVRIIDLAHRMIQLAGFIPHKDIKIEYTGLRPGEKLYEEVLSTHEDTIPTLHEKIRIAKVRKYSHTEVLPRIRNIIGHSFTGDEWRCIELTKQMIPEYRSENSRFEKLDKVI